MDILIRDVPDDICKIINKKTKKANVSRQIFLLTWLCRMAQMDSFIEERNEYSTLIKTMGKVIENNSKELSYLIDKIDEMSERI